MRQWKACTNAEKQTKLNSTHKKIGKTFTIVFYKFQKFIKHNNENLKN